MLCIHQQPSVPDDDIELSGYYRTVLVVVDRIVAAIALSVPELSGPVVACHFISSFLVSLKEQERFYVDSLSVAWHVRQSVLLKQL